MNKRIKKIIIFIFIAFFCIITKVSAANQAGWIYPTCMSLRYPNSNNYFKLPGVGKNMQAKYIGIYNIDNRHVYCIEPGVSLSVHNYNSQPFERDYKGQFFTDNVSNVAYKKTLIQQILTFAKYLGPNIPETSSNKNTSSCGTYVGEGDTFQVFAAQALIWEVVTGERTSFNSVEPDNNYRNSNSFYNTYIKNYRSQGNTTTLANEYSSIVFHIQNSFNAYPNSFSLAAVGNPTSLSWNESIGQYSITINDFKFRYWDIVKTDGLSVSKTDNSITISSSTPISENNPKKIEIKVHNKNGNDNGATAYYYGGSQNLISVDGITKPAYIKVYTPKYQLKISKIASLDKKALSGAKFNICSNSSCTKVIGTVTTDKNGEATYQSIPAPGTYYVKEINAPAGYELDSSPRAITVSSSNIAGSSSYGVITVTDNNRLFNLTKKTVDENGNVIDLDDGCGTDNYTGPEFEIKENGNSLYFKEVKPGEYDLANKDDQGATTKLRTCKGKFKVYTLTNCNYTISETKAPEGLTLPSEPNKSINVCGSDKNVSFTNGFAGLEFQKKDEDGNFLQGGKFSLQKKVNNVYRDILLKQVEDGSYVYDANLKEEDEGATYIILTNNGIARISKLAPGEYRVVEKEAPERFELIKDKDSKALVTIKDSDKAGYYLVEMIDQTVRKNGSEASAELVVTITTGRKVPNYVLIISALVVMLVIAIFIRKKIKK